MFAYIVDGSPEELQSALDITLRRFAEYHNLQGAFGRRAQTERAKGILMERYQVDERQAFDDAARSRAPQRTEAHPRRPGGARRATARRQHDESRLSAAVAIHPDRGDGSHAANSLDGVRRRIGGHGLRLIEQRCTQAVRRRPTSAGTGSICRPRR